ncbi:MAG: hypothetical protein V2I24_14100 [Halieaceae bacterium]|nr:hypothetical protein [Halieaceae bacterium]
MQYGVGATYEYNENLTLTPDPIAVSGGSVALPVTLRRRSERLDASLDAEVAAYRYDVEEYNSDNQDLQGRLAYELERGKWDVHAGYLRDTTRNSEFLDTGIVGPAATRRETASAGGSVSNLLTERNGIVAGLDYQDVTYAADRFNDFDFLSGYGGWLHQWSPLMQLRLQVYGNRFETRGASVDVRSEGLGAQGGIDTQFSERLSLAVLAGWIRVDTSYSASVGVVPPSPDSDDGFLLDARLTYQSERSRWNLRFKREPAPSGIGVLLNTDRLDVDYRYRFTERVNLVASANVGRQEAQDIRLNQDRDFARGSVRLDYRLREDWYLAARYQYSWQDAEFFPDTADASAVYVSVRYEPLARTWSR